MNERLVGLKYHKQFDNTWNCAIDAGVCTGYYSRLYCKLFSQVIGVEPNVESKERLEKLKNTYSNYNYYQAAAYNKTGFKKFYGCNKMGYSGLDLSYIKRVSSNETDITLKEYDVQLITLDSLNVKPNFIKIDVEGSSMEVLEGAKNLIRDHQPTIQIEKAYESQNWLKENNYVCVFDSPEYSDFVFVHKDKVKIENDR